MYDARTNPRGWKLSIQEWPRHARVRQIARRQGYRIPAPSFVTPEATPARALLNHGVWRAWCPDCPYAAEDVWRGFDLFWCMRCGNASAGHAWRPLIWPQNLAEIEANLEAFPTQAQNWEPWGEAVDYVAVAQEWVDHAAPMTDPEHGLTDNEVGGEDDPETYTTPALAVTNAVIASSDANADKGDIRYFRQFLSANPSGADYIVAATGANAGGWAKLTEAMVTPSALTGNSGSSAIGTGAIHANRIQAASFDASQVNAAFASGSIDGSTRLSDGSVTELKLAALSRTLVGEIKLYAPGAEPTASGWKFCNGQALNRTTFALLYTAIGTAYGAGDGSTTFNVPNLMDRVPIGAGSTYAVSTTGGAATPSIAHTHTLGAHIHNSAAHTHTGPSHTHTGPSHSHSLAAAGISGNTGGPSGTNTTGSTGNTSADGSHTHGVGTMDVTGTTDAGGTGATGADGTGATGSTTPPDTSTPSPDTSGGASATTVSVIQPYLALNYIIYTGVAS